MMNLFHGMRVPEHMTEGLTLWIEHGVPPGSFLMAVLENDLREAVGRADDINIRNIPAFVAYLWNEAPALCWGSPEKCAAWIKHHERRRAGERLAAIPASEVLIQADRT